MSKTNNTTKYGFGILALTLIFLPFYSTAMAEQFMPVQGYQADYTPTYYYQPVVVVPQPQVVATPTPTIYSTSTNPNQAAASTAPKPKTVAKATATEPTAETVDDKYALLNASAILGTSGFMPTGLIGWVLLGVLLLLIIVIVRKIAGGDKMYHSTPLKHS